jgi:hypothetical protein
MGERTEGKGGKKKGHSERKPPEEKESYRRAERAVAGLIKTAVLNRLKGLAESFYEH